jgi:hypothetical protein
MNSKEGFKVKGTLRGRHNETVDILNGKFLVQLRLKNALQVPG